MKEQIHRRDAEENGEDAEANREAMKSVLCDLSVDLCASAVKRLVR
jgi:hypothetical protein